jgi:hypothetical protein
VTLLNECGASLIVAAKTVLTPKAETNEAACLAAECIFATTIKPKAE